MKAKKKVLYFCTPKLEKMKRSIKSIFSLFLFITTTFCFQKSESAVIFNKEFSPYYIDSTIVINENDTLLIEKGAVIYLDTNVNIMVYGWMFINGTVDEPVQILPVVDTTGWGIIEIDHPGANCEFKNATIVDGRITTKDVNLKYRNITFITRQNLPLYTNVTRVIRGSADIKNCSISGIGKGEGFWCGDMKNAIISDCFFENIPDAIKFTYVRYSTIRKNSFFDIPDDAIDLNNCNDILIDSNLIMHTTDRGMEIGSETYGSSENISVIRNIVSRCKEAIVFKEGSYGEVINNTLYKNETGISSIELVPGTGGSSINIQNTIFSDSQLQDINVDSFSSVSISYSLTDNETPLPGEENISDSPDFVAPDSNNFNLQENSPCIDKGNPLSQYDPDNTIADIGALYYQQGNIVIPTDTGIYGINSVHIAPNPFNTYLAVQLKINKPTHIIVDVYTLSGTHVLKLCDAYLDTPNNPNQTIAIQVNDQIFKVRKGYYIFVARIDNKTKAFRIAHQDYTIMY